MPAFNYGALAPFKHRLVRDKVRGNIGGGVLWATCAQFSVVSDAPPSSALIAPRLGRNVGGRGNVVITSVVKSVLSRSKVTIKPRSRNRGKISLRTPSS